MKTLPLRIDGLDLGSFGSELCHTIAVGDIPMCGIGRESVGSLHEWIAPDENKICPTCGKKSCPTCDLLSDIDAICHS